MSAAGPMSERRIAHLDMDAFYASVELLRYPQLAGQPVVIGGRRSGAGRDGAAGFERLADYAGRGVVTTATYVAREFGVHSGMALMHAARLCPQAVLLPADFEHYRHYSLLFQAAVSALAPPNEECRLYQLDTTYDVAPTGTDTRGLHLTGQTHPDRCP